MSIVISLLPKVSRHVAIDDRFTQNNTLNVVYTNNLREYVLVGSPTNLLSRVPTLCHFEIY